MTKALQSIRYIDQEICYISSNSFWLRGRMDAVRKTDYGLYSELERELAALTRELAALQGQRQQILSRIAAVPDARLRTLLRLRYELGQSWAEIGQALSLGRTQLWRMHKKALDGLGEDGGGRRPLQGPEALHPSHSM